jgi:DNA-binding transcriptional LysR family regulator
MLLFAAVVREGSFTRAARHLGVSKQTVSERIGNLEERLGVRLLERTTRTLRVTDAGAGYAERCASIAAQIEEANQSVQQAQGEPTGLIRISTPVLYGRRYLAPIVAEYLARHPKTRIEILLADRRVQLVEEGFDLAIRVGPLDDSSAASRRLGDGHTYWVASPEYLRAYGMPAAERLHEARCITLQPFETWNVGGVSTKVRPVLVVNDLEVACEAAMAGVGIMRAPSIVCRDAVTQGRLVVLFREESAVVRPVYAVYPSRRHLPAKVKLFVDLLAQRVAPMKPIPPAAMRAKPIKRARATAKSR